MAFQRRPSSFNKHKKKPERHSSAPGAYRSKPGQAQADRAAPHRVEQSAEPTPKVWHPPCPHYPACHGCPFVSIPYNQQLLKKQHQITAALTDYTSLQHIAVPVPIASSRRFGYRARVKLAVQRVKGKTVIGLYRPESHQIIDASACPVHPPQINKLVAFLRQAIDQLQIAPYDEVHDTGQLRYLDIRYSFWQRRTLLTLVTRRMHFPQVRELTRTLGRHFPELVGVVQNINDTPGGNVIWGERFHPLRGRDSLLEQFGHLRLHSPADAFTQVNPFVAQKLYETTLEWAGLSGREIALDLYCGIGPIALYLASRAKLVIGIDDNARAIRVAKENARRNGYHNTRFFAGDAARKLKETTFSLSHIDCIVVNPPRKGLNPEAFSALIGTDAPRLLYVSCEPRTLARDLDQLSQVGYQVVKVQPFDMFPQTDKVETLVLLEKMPQSQPYKAAEESEAGDEAV